jgi:hypothetical protein
MRRSRSAQGERRDFSSLTKCQNVDTNARPWMAGPDRGEAARMARPTENNGPPDNLGRVTCLGNGCL